VEMVKLVLACALLPLAASAAGFTLTIGPPVAAGAGAKVVKKSAAVFAVRLEECGELDTAQVGGTAEGIVDGQRKSGALTIAAAGSPGVYVVSLADSENHNDNPGVWLVSLSASCGKAKAGAIVPMGPQGFLREGTKVLPRSATKADIDFALKALEKPSR
jgi:hypothetical protein